MEGFFRAVVFAGSSGWTSSAVALLDLIVADVGSTGAGRLGMTFPLVRWQHASDLKTIVSAPTRRRIPFRWASNPWALPWCAVRVLGCIKQS